MYLKAIELSGFKSFAERVRLDFAGGLTAIVGANGSGKSNIIDAVLWVLGEQNVRNLRGARMEEIIFSGSEKKRAVGLAEVILYIDNSAKLLKIDYDEIAIMRRLYRDASSEYYINRQPCRLKDIVELFLDTGVGRDSFSIIGQGQVDEILSYKPAERRVILEEVAGIAKFKYRKREALSKLDRLKDRLQRVDDILAEISNQTIPLQDQAKKAQAYLEVRRDLRENERKFYEIERQRLTHLKEKLTEQDQKQKDGYLTAQAALAAESAIREGMRLEQIKAEQDTEESNQLSSKLLLQIEQSKSQKELFLQRQIQLKAEVLRLEEQIELNILREKDLSTSLEALIEELSRLAQAETSYQLAWQENKSSLDQLLNQEAGRKAEEDKLILRAHELKLQLSQLQGRLEGLVVETLSRKNSIQTQQEELQRFNEGQKQLEAEILTQKVSCNQIEDSLKRQNEALNSEETRLESLNLLIDENVEQARQNETSYRLATNRLHTLKDLADQMEGYQRGVKAIMQKKRRNPQLFNEIHSTIASLFRVKKEHETAIEMVLGSNLQFIVTDTPRGAEEAISWLKKEKAGRATFFPLSSIKGQADLALWQRVKNEPGVLALASHLIETDTLYQKVADSLLGNVIVLQDLASANALAAKLNFRNRLVTLEGDLVYPSGAVTGGSLYNSSVSLLGREREIEELERETAKTQKKIELLQKEILEQKEEQKAIKESIIALRQDKQETEQKLSSLTFALMQMERDLLNRFEQLKALEKNINKAQEELNSLETTEAELQKQERDNSAEILILENELLALEDPDVQELITLRRSELSSKEIEKALNSQQKQNVEAEKLQQERQLHQIEEQLQKGHLDLSLAKKSLKNDEEELMQNDAEISRLVEEQEKAAQSYNRGKEKVRDLRLKLSEQEEQIFQARKNEDKAREEAYHSQAALAKIESEWEYLKEKIANDYELSPEQALWPEVLDPSLGPELQKACNRLRNKIREMGLVNLGAIEELERLQKRETYLKEQGEDIRQSCQGILKILSEIDKDMEDKFSQAFQKVNEKFKEVFTQLFQGGQASLQLTEPEDLLQTGLDIVAQLPGKRAGNLSLLSGGEKALTAVALLIAILQVKKPPFVFLDEVETSLDEGNVKRVAGVLRECAAHTQIISVSHRKGLMEEADALVGVTMQSPGVSTVVSVRFADKEK